MKKELLLLLLVCSCRNELRHDERLSPSRISSIYDLPSMLQDSDIRTFRGWVPMERTINFWKVNYYVDMDSVQYSFLIRKLNRTYEVRYRDTFYPYMSSPFLQTEYQRKLEGAVKVLKLQENLDIWINGYPDGLTRFGRDDTTIIYKYDTAHSMKEILPDAPVSIPMGGNWYRYK